MSQDANQSGIENELVTGEGRDGDPHYSGGASSNQDEGDVGHSAAHRDSSLPSGAIPGEDHTTSVASAPSGASTVAIASQHLYGNDGEGHLMGGDGNDYLEGGGGANVLAGGNGDDLIFGGMGRGISHQDGGHGDDVLVAGGSRTHLLDDFLRANPNVVDSIITDPALAGLNSLLQAAPNDISMGAENIFELHSENGNDSIFNFHSATDRLQIDRVINGSDISSDIASHITVSGDDLTIDLGGNNSVTLVGVDIAQFSMDNLIFG